MRFVLPLRLVDLYTEDGAVQVLAAWAVDFCFKFFTGHRVYWG